MYQAHDYFLTEVTTIAEQFKWPKGGRSHLIEVAPQ